MQPECADQIRNVFFEEGTWSFENEQVVDNFPSIAEANIPNYRAVIQKCVQIARKFCRPDSLIVDVGCARGATLKALFESGFTNLTGVDCSKAMLAKSFSQADLIASEIYPPELKLVDLVLINWTLHFIREREKYLRDIFHSLRGGGRLVLTEKVSGGQDLKDLYDDFKRQSGMSETEIRRKENAIKGVLVTQPMDWYFRTLSEIGFKDIAIIDAHFSFVTFYATK